MSKKLPNAVHSRRELNLRLGIKSSLSNHRPMIALLYIIYKYSDNCCVEYSEEYKDSKGLTQIRLKQGLSTHIPIGTPIEVIDRINLFTSQLEALQVGIELFYKFGKINFADDSLPDTKERTGGERFNKKIRFGLNMRILDIIFSKYSRDDVDSFLTSWLKGESSSFAELENNVKEVLSIFSEDTQFEIGAKSGSVVFQREGIYDVLKEGNVVSNQDIHEATGPLRVLKAYVKEDMNPFVESTQNGFELRKDKKEIFEKYADMTSATLDLLPKRVTIYVPEVEASKNDNGLQASAGLDKQIIYYGAPGTGKSFQLKKDTESFNHIRTIFHPDSDYASFVGCYKPVMDGDKIKYDFRAQAFINAYVNAWLSKDPYYLIIEEINRGNCAQIFGDIFQLLDRKNGVSDYTVVPDADLEIYLSKTFHSEKNQAIIKEKGLVIPNDILEGTGMRLPANFFLRATMNTSDQSLFPMDSAFKRRWAWKHFSIKDEGKGYKIEVDENHVYDWWKTIDTLNRKIYGETKSADKQIGYWFAKLPDNVTVISKDDFVSKVLFYLWNDVFKDYGFDSKNAFSEEIQFDKFFTSDGKVNASMVVKFMENNGIKPEEKETTEDSAEEEQQ